MRCSIEEGYYSISFYYCNTPTPVLYIYCGFGRGAQWFVIMLSKYVPLCTNGMGWNTAEERTKIVN